MNRQFTEVLIGGFVGLFAEALKINFILFYAFCMVLIFDLVSGALIALIQHKFCSSVLKVGALKKALEVIIVVMLLFVNIAIGQIGINLPLGSIIIGAFLIKDAVSILENYNKVGKVPPIITDWLIKVQSNITLPKKEDKNV